MNTPNIKTFAKIILLTLILTLAQSCSTLKKSDTSGLSTPKTARKATPKKIDDLVAKLTQEEKVGQLLFLALRGEETDDGYLPHYTFTAQDAELLQKTQPGGVAIFSENIKSGELLCLLTTAIKDAIRTPPFIATDQEGGRVQRIRRTREIAASKVPPMLTLGQKSASTVYKTGRKIANDLAKYGFNMDFAPVCDVFSNPENSVIGDRAFAKEPALAAKMSLELTRALEDGGIVPVCKHFPGHGDTAQDTHKGTVILNKTLSELYATELIPFAAQIEHGVAAIMVAHISLPQYTGDALPASLSSKIISELLRGTLGYDGVVITDAMDMHAITDQFTSGQSAVMAIQAGADMVLMPHDPLQAYEAILTAVQNGELSQAQLDKSVARILTAKYEYSLLN